MDLLSQNLYKRFLLLFNRLDSDMDSSSIDLLPSTWMDLFPSTLLDSPKIS